MFLFSGVYTHSQYIIRSSVVNLYTSYSVSVSQLEYGVVNGDKGQNKTLNLVLLFAKGPNAH
jgi:hypothetical protein